MKRTFAVIASLVMTSFLFVGCIGADPTTEEEDENVSDVEQALPICYNTTTYYSNAAKTTVVGVCIDASICTGPSRTCTGQQTDYFDVDRDCCED
ncbi:MAG: hypothetical protein IT372_22100 [Polyangiaceae bacterium]|nr:hypothetical protein [Polyangiaceae bacterium]